MIPLSVTGAQIGARMRQDALLADLHSLGLRLAVFDWPDGDGYRFTIQAKDGSGPVLRFTTGAEVEQLVADEKARQPPREQLQASATKPSVGLTVHYVSYGTPAGEYRSECRAAIVTEVGGPSSGPLAGPTAGLCVLNPEGMFFNRGVTYHGGDTGHDHAGEEIVARSYPGGTWHWPERSVGEMAG